MGSWTRPWEQGYQKIILCISLYGDSRSVLYIVAKLTYIPAIILMRFRRHNIQHQRLHWLVASSVAFFMYSMNFTYLKQPTLQELGNEATGLSFFLHNKLSLPLGWLLLAEHRRSDNVGNF